MHCAEAESFAENAICLEQKDIQCFYFFLWVKHGNRMARNRLCFPQEDSTKEERAELFEEKRPFEENKRNLDDIKKMGKKTLSL